VKYGVCFWHWIHGSSKLCALSSRADSAKQSICCKSWGLVAIADNEQAICCLWSVRGGRANHSDRFGGNKKLIHQDTSAVPCAAAEAFRAQAKGRVEILRTNISKIDNVIQDVARLAIGIDFLILRPRRIKRPLRPFGRFVKLLFKPGRHRSMMRFKRVMRTAIKPETALVMNAGAIAAIDYLESCVTDRVSSMRNPAMSVGEL
jgi:hypothetical protein